MVCFKGFVGSSTRVSNELGAGKAKAAAMAVRVVVVLGVAEGIALGVLLISLRNIWGYLFTNEQEVVSYLSLIMPILAVSNFMDAVQGVLSGNYSIMTVTLVIERRLSLI